MPSLMPVGPRKVCSGSSSSIGCGSTPESFAGSPRRRTSALIGVAVDADDDLRIWGLVHQGPRWLRDAVGGREAGPELPSLPVVHVVAPGSLEARCGADLVGRLERGAVSGTRLDVFKARWLPDEFGPLQVKQFRRHALARDRAEAAGERWASIDPELPRLIDERVVKRALAVVRRQRHGGTILFVPFEAGDELSRPNPFLNIKYRLAETHARRRFFEVTLQILNRLAQLQGARGHDIVDWSDFEVTADEDLAALDEALFELAYLIVGLTGVDGALVLDKHMQILGFGAEISGRLPDVAVVDRALDREGESVIEEPAASEGTRHRSAYRLIRRWRDPSRSSSLKTAVHGSSRARTGASPTGSTSSPRLTSV